MPREPLLPWLLDVLGPRRCPGCDYVLDVARPFCGGCEPLLEPAPGGGAVDSAFLLQGPLADAVHRLKYRERLDLAGPLAEALLERLEAEAMREQLQAEAMREPPFAPGPLAAVLPVPLHPARLAERGFNQSTLLAAPIARRLGVPLWPWGLRRVRVTRSQVGLSRAERRANVQDAFAARRRVAGRDLLLVDDVITSGATLQAAQEALLRAGARTVRCWTLARAEMGGTTAA